jgi:hypothetical protein
MYIIRLLKHFYNKFLYIGVRILYSGKCLHPFPLPTSDQFLPAGSGFRNIIINPPSFRNASNDGVCAFIYLELFFTSVLTQVNQIHNVVPKYHLVHQPRLSLGSPRAHRAQGVRPGL